MTSDRFRSANLTHWDEKSEFNLKTWDVEAFLADPGKLTTIVETDRHEFGAWQR